jgi:hypothetical protein
MAMSMVAELLVCSIPTVFFYAGARAEPPVFSVAADKSII